MVEHATENRSVGGSIPPLATLKPDTTAFRTVALFDLAVTWPFAIPGLSSVYLNAFLWLDHWLGFHTPPLALDAMGHLFVNLAGVLCICWNGARAFGFGRVLAPIDVAGRIAVATLVALYVAAWGVSPIVLVFFVTELVGAVWQGRALRNGAALT